MNRLFLIIALVIAAGAIIAVYESERRYDAAEVEARKVEREIAATRREVHVLNVEWSYLTRPERLQELAEMYLPLEPASAARMIGSDGDLQSALDTLNGVEVAKGAAKP
ncbi:MAG: hypothetical protein P1U65_18530 [Minwuia sp.]|nr:hypothetical protein [Minwuia sp.]